MEYAGMGASAGNPEVAEREPARKPRWRRIFALPVLLLLLVAASVIAYVSVASATTPSCTINWTGAAGTSDWGTSGNWTVISNGSHRVPASSDFVCMATSPTSTSVVLAGGQTSTVQGINFSQNGSVAPSLEVDGTLNLNPSTTTGAVSSTIYSLNVVGIIAGNNLQSVSVGSLTASGTLEGPATYTVSGAATVNNPTLGLNGTASKKTHVILQGNTSLAGTVYMTDGSELENQGTITQADGSNFYNYDGNTGNEVVNDSGATITYTGSASSQSAYSQAPLQNMGSVVVNAGILQLQSGGTSTADTGSFTAASGATLDLNGTRTEGSGATMAGAGTIDIQGTTTFNSGALVTNTGTFQVDGALKVPSGASLSTPNLVANGSLEGPGTLTVTGAVTLNNPTLGVSGTAGLQLHLILQGNTSLAGTVYMTDGSELENQGTITQADGSNFYNYDANAANMVVNDSGATITYTGTTSTSNAYSQAPLQNMGSVVVNAGILQLQSGGTSTADTGSFTAASGATLDLNGTRTEGSGSKMAGAGTIDIQGGSTTFNSGALITNTGTFQVDGALIVPSGASLSTPNLVANGSLEGPGTLTVTGTATLNSPTLGVSGTNGLQLHLILQGNTSLAGTLYLTDGSEVENRGAITQADGSNFYNYDANTGNEVVNDSGASITYTGTTSTSNAYAQAPLQNMGSVVVNAGILQLQSGGTSTADTGSFTAASGATLDLNGTRTEGSGATMAGSGTIDIQGTDTFSSGSTATNSGTFIVDGTLIAPSGVTVSLGNLTANGSLEGPGSFTVSGPATLSSPTLGVNGTNGLQTHLTLQGTSRVTGTVYLTDGSELENQGQITQADGSNFWNYDGNTGNEVVNDSGASITYTGSTTTSNAYVQAPLTNNGTINANKGILNVGSTVTNLNGSGVLTGGTWNATGGTLNLPSTVTSNGATVQLGASPSALETGSSNALATMTSNTGSLDLKQSLATTSPVGNSGTVTVESGTFSTSSGYSQSAGTTTVLSGATLKAGSSGVAISGGNLTGNGAISGKLIGGGNVTPRGATGGPMSVSSTFDNNSGTLTIPVSGTSNAGTDYGQLSATGAVTLSGTLALQTANGFLPPDGTSYTLVQGSSLTGTFSSVTGATLSDRKYALTYNANNVTATVHYFPIVTAVSPASGSTAGGNTVTITGQHFQATTATGAATGVSFGGVPATSFTVVDDSHITATAPAGSAGTVDVTVTGPYGTSPTSTVDQYTYVPPPTVSGVSPATGPASGGTAVTISGSHFTGASAVKFGSNAATSYTVTDDGHISATAPAGSGLVDVTVTTVGGTSSTSSADQFGYIPVVTGVSPNTGPASGGTSVTITGSGFTGATVVSFGSNAAQSPSVVDDGHITATSPAGSGTVDVTVTGPAGTGTSATSSADQFTYQSSGPSVTGVSPTAGPATGNTSVTITGSGLTGATGVTFGGTAATNVKVVDDGHVTATAPKHAAGTVDVQVTTPSGTSQTSSADRYSYDSLPTVASIKASADGPLGGGNTVTVNGANFVSGATTVMFGSSPGTNVQVSTSKVLTVVAPASSTAGSVDVTVTTPGGTSTKSSKDLYAYGPPTISSFTPASGITGSTVKITGSGFAAGIVVTFGSFKSSKVTVTSGTTLNAVVPNGDTLASTIKVSDPQGSQTSSAQFTPTMGITNFSPTSGSISSGTVVTINGIGFSADSVVAFNKVNASTTYVNSQQLTAVVPAGSSTGYITVTSPSTDSPSGTVTSVAKFTVNP